MRRSFEFDSAREESSAHRNCILFVCDECVWNCIGHLFCYRCPWYHKDTNLYKELVWLLIPSFTGRWTRSASKPRIFKVSKKGIKGFVKEDLCGPPLCVAYTSPTIFCSPMKKVQDFLKNCKSVQLMVNHWWSASDRGHYGHIARDNDKWQHNDNEKWNRVAWTESQSKIIVYMSFHHWKLEPMNLNATTEITICQE